ncbi:hypothetical protein M413DRAFT_14832 [Hebeloma cylindrosporum]|uniref:Uncharacterized protein n=1 Tax=Hebeloma cylindrosporum TaxID=76867 RepID=A0A0C2XA90_HEBCY|nr:hypothetical protein M413DRAFT_14832 [Hebeloma cylindrosporum h7]
MRAVVRLRISRHTSKPPLHQKHISSDHISARSGYLEREIPQKQHWVPPHTNIFCGPSAYRSPSSDEGKYLVSAFPEECQWVPEPQLMKPEVVGGPSVQSTSHRKQRSSSSQEGVYLGSAFPAECRWVPEPQLMKPAVMSGPSVQSTLHRKPRSSSAQEGDYLEEAFPEQHLWVPEPQLMKPAVISVLSEHSKLHRKLRSLSSQEGDYLEEAFPEQQQWVPVPQLKEPAVRVPESQLMKPAVISMPSVHSKSHWKPRSSSSQEGDYLEAAFPEPQSWVPDALLIQPPVVGGPGGHPMHELISAGDHDTINALAHPIEITPQVIPPMVQYPKIDFINCPGLHKAAHGPQPVNLAGYPWPNFNNIADADKPGAGILSLPADPALTYEELLHCHNCIEGLTPEMLYVRAAAFVYTSCLHQLCAKQMGMQSFQAS